MLQYYIKYILKIILKIVIYSFTIVREDTKSENIRTEKVRRKFKKIVYNEAIKDASSVIRLSFLDISNHSPSERDSSKDIKVFINYIQYVIPIE